MKGFRLQVLGLSIFFVLLSTVTCTLLPISAADSTPSSDIKVKLEELKKEIASKAAKLKTEITNQLQNKAYIGKIKQKSETSLNLATLSGPKIVTINQDTILPKKKLSEEDYVASLGDIDETGVLTAKKIILLPTNNSPLKTYLWGQVISVSDKLVTLKNKEGKNIAVATNTKLNINQFVILSGNKNKNDIFEAVFTYIIPQGGILRSKKIATPSSSP